jgi:hypothetical protein
MTHLVLERLWTSPRCKPMFHDTEIPQSLFDMMQVRELEEEVDALAVGKEHRRKLKELMNKKELVGDLFNNLRLTRQRLNNSARANSSTIAPAGNGSSSGHNSGSQSSSSSSSDSGDGWQVSATPSPCTVGLCTAVIRTMTLPGHGAM